MTKYSDAFLLAIFGVHINKRHTFSVSSQIIYVMYKLTSQHCSRPAGPVQKIFKSASSASSSFLCLTNGFNLACYFHWGDYWWQANSVPEKENYKAEKKKKKVKIKLFIFTYMSVFQMCSQCSESAHFEVLFQNYKCLWPIHYSSATCNSIIKELSTLTRLTLFCKSIMKIQEFPLS